jgi:hypothetical protein
MGVLNQLMELIVIGASAVPIDSKGEYTFITAKKDSIF